MANMPGLSAAQQVYSDMTGINAPYIALDDAAAYPLGVTGIILTIISLKTILRFGGHVRPIHP